MGMRVRQESSCCALLLLIGRVDRSLDSIFLLSTSSMTFRCFSVSRETKARNIQRFNAGLVLALRVTMRTTLRGDVCP